MTASTLSVELSDFTCHVSNEICTLQDVIDNATAKLTPEQLSAISSISSKLEASDICANYINNVISLSVKGNQILSVDCNDFFNADGRLSTVELLSNTLVFAFNTEEATPPISVDLTSFINTDVYASDIAYLSGEISAKADTSAMAITDVDNDTTKKSI